MARYTGAVCKLCRREGTKLFLKGDRCYSNKCSIERKDSLPGKNAKTTRIKKLSTYGIRLREKQKLRKYYGLLEKQFKNYFQKAERKKGITGENLLELLERRLDNVVFRLGITKSKAQARQLILHSHILVNGKKVNIPSYQVKKDDVIELREKSKKIQTIIDSLDAIVRRGIPQWLEINKEKFKGEVLGVPVREDITLPIQEQLIVELYSK